MAEKTLKSLDRRLPIGTVRQELDYGKQYEYLIFAVGPKEGINSRSYLTEHAEYGKWELQRTRIYTGGIKQFWLRRRVMRVSRTI